MVPVVLGDDVLGLVGLHTRARRANGSTTKFRFCNRSPDRSRSVTSTRDSTPTKSAKLKPSARLLAIANALNARSDFREVSSLVLERAIALVGADYSALGVLDPKGGRISLAAFKAAPHAPLIQFRA